MPKEVRYILFAPQEVLAALLEQEEPGWRRGGTGLGMPQLELFTDAGGHVVARLTRSRPGESAPQREIVEADLVSALLRRCRALRIPLPRRGHKTLELMGERLAMSVMLNIEPTVIETHAGAIRYSDADAAQLRPPGR